MSAPIAGRRKGQGTAAAGGSLFSQPNSGAARDGGEPAWLFGDVATNTATTTAAPAQATAPAAAAPGPSPSAPSASTDPLDFLNFDSAPPPPAASAVTPSASSPRNVTQPPPSATDGLDFLNFDDDLPPPAPTATVTKVTTQDVADAPFTLFSTGNDPYTRPVNDKLVRDYEALFTQFTQLDEELAHSNAVVSAIEGGSHDVVREYEMAESELTQLRDKVAEAQRAVTETRAVQETQQEANASAVQATKQSQRDDATAAARAAWTRKLQSIHAQIEAQQQSLEATREAYRRMQSDVAASSVSESTVRALETRLGGLVRTMRGDFGLLVKPLLSRTIQGEMAAAAQQRADIYRQDAQARREALRAFTQTRMEAFTAYLAERATARTNASDALFGELARELEAFRDARTTERQRRLLDFQSSLKEHYETSSAAIRDHLKRQVEIDERCLAHDMETNATEERQLRQRLSQQRALFRERAVEERKLVTRASLPSQGSTQRASSLSTTTAVAEVAERRYRSVMEALNQKARRLLLDVHTARELCRSASTARSRPSETHGQLGDACEQLRARKRAAEEASRQTGASLERWRSAVQPLADVVSRMNASLQHGRVRLAGLHESVRETRRLWETDVRRALAQSLVSHSGPAQGLAWPADALTDTLYELTARVDQHRQREQQLRDGRMGFVHTQEAHMQQLKRAYVESHGKLQDVFSAYDQVTRTGAQLEAHRIALEAAAADLEAVEAGLESDRAATVRLHEHIRHQAREVEEIGAALEGDASPPFEDITQSDVNRRNTAATVASDSSSSLTPDLHRHDPLSTKGVCRAPGLPLSSPQQSRQRACVEPQLHQSQPGVRTKQTPSLFPPTFVCKGESASPLSCSPAQRHDSRRLSAQTDLHMSQAASASDASPHSVFRSTTTLATDFSTSLVGFDEEDDDTMAVDDIVVHDPDNHYPGRVRQTPRMYAARHSPSVDAVPHVEQTNLGHSLTTPSTSE